MPAANYVPVKITLWFYSRDEALYCTVRGLIEFSNAVPVYTVESDQTLVSF